MEDDKAYSKMQEIHELLKENDLSKHSASFTVLLTGLYLAAHEMPEGPSKLIAKETVVKVVAQMDNRNQLALALKEFISG